MSGTVVASIVGDNSAEKQLKEYHDKTKPALASLIKASGKALYARVNVACVKETAMNGGQFHLTGDHEGDGTEIFHEITVDLLESQAFSPNFGGAIVKYVERAKENKKRKEQGLPRLSQETGIARSGGRVNTFDIFTEEEYTTHMKTKNTVQSFPVAAPAITA